MTEETSLHRHIGTIVLIVSERLFCQSERSFGNTTSDLFMSGLGRDRFSNTIYAQAVLEASFDAPCVSKDSAQSFNVYRN